MTRGGTGVERAGVWTIVVAAGSGSRFGAPKQFETLGTMRVIDWSVGEAARHSEGVVIVVPPVEGPGDHRPEVADGVICEVVGGGATRSESVRRGLAVVPDSADVVVVHDAARPLASGPLYRSVIQQIRSGADAAVPALALTDTIRHRSGGTVDRGELMAVQTPQAFRPDLLRLAHERSLESTDDATIVEAVGAAVTLVEGDPRNLKITTPADLELVAAWLSREAARGG